MKTITYEEFLEFAPYWLGKAEWVKPYFDRFGGKMSALDILKLHGMCAEDKLCISLREELIPAPILHEFACVCAEYALSLIEAPDPRSIKAIEVKRAWLRGEATEEGLVAAYDAARVAAYDTSSRTAYWAAQAAVEAAWTGYDAASEAAWRAASAAWDAAWDAAKDASVASQATVFEAQVAYLIMALEE